MPESALPQLWWPVGAGGHWVNYITWCGLNQSSIPGEFKNFHFDTLPGMVNGVPYQRYYDRNRHSVPLGAHVKIGSRRAGFNFLLNVAHKTDMNDQVELWMSVRQFQQIKHFFDFKDCNDFNLDWCLIFENPELFVQTLAQLSGYNISWDQHTARAVEQYVNSCYWHFMTVDELKNEELIQVCHDFCMTQLIEQYPNVDERQQAAWVLLDTVFWTKFSSGLAQS